MLSFPLRLPFHLELFEVIGSDSADLLRCGCSLICPQGRLRPRKGRDLPQLPTARHERNSRRVFFSRTHQKHLVFPGHVWRVARRVTAPAPPCPHLPTAPRRVHKPGSKKRKRAAGAPAGGGSTPAQVPADTDCPYVGIERGSSGSFIAKCAKAVRGDEGGGKVPKKCVRPACPPKPWHHVMHPSGPVPARAAGCPRFLHDCRCRASGPLEILTGAAATARSPRPAFVCSLRRKYLGSFPTAKAAAEAWCVFLFRCGQSHTSQPPLPGVCNRTALSATHAAVRPTTAAPDVS